VSELSSVVEIYRLSELRSQRAQRTDADDVIAHDELDNDVDDETGTTVDTLDTTGSAAALVVSASAATRLAAASVCVDGACMV
jgi:hypothetical protein